VTTARPSGGSDCELFLELLTEKAGCCSSCCGGQVVFAPAESEIHTNINVNQNFITNINVHAPEKIHSFEKDQIEDIFGEFSERFGFDGKLEDLFALFHQEKPVAWTTTTTTSAPMTTQQIDYKREVCDEYLRALIRKLHGKGGKINFDHDIVISVDIDVEHTQRHLTRDQLQSAFKQFCKEKDISADFDDVFKHYKNHA